MNKTMSRRSLLRQAAFGGAGLVILGDRLSTRSYAANEKVNVGLIGVGGRGRWFVGTMPNLSNVVAMCDVNTHKAKLSFDELPQAKKYSDFRKMLDETDKDIDAVVIATPDNTHAVAAAAAIKRGKGVFVEKPLTHDVQEARALRELAVEYKVATQMGNQGTASGAFRRSVELVRDGVLGDVGEVYAWNTGGGPGDRPTPTEVHEIPEYLKWDLWLGPAAFREYNSRWLSWHGWRDFGTGQLGNWGCHTMNLAFKALKIDSLWHESDAGAAKPQRIRVEPEVSGVHENSFPRTEVLHYHIPPRGQLPAVTVHWCNGPGKAPGCRERVEDLLGRKLDWGDAGEKRWADHGGIFLIGSKGMLHSIAHNTTLTLVPEDKFKGLDGPPEKLPRSRGHEREWLDAIKGGTPAMSNFNYSGPLAEFVLLGNIATLVGETIEFDPLTTRITNSDKADQALKRTYRKGWTL